MNQWSAKISMLAVIAATMMCANAQVPNPVSPKQSSKEIEPGTTSPDTAVGTPPARGAVRDDKAQDKSVQTPDADQTGVLSHPPSDPSSGVQPPRPASGGAPPRPESAPASRN